MNNMFHHFDMTQILNRIDALSPQSQPLWGKWMLPKCCLTAPRSKTSPWASQTRQEAG